MPNPTYNFGPQSGIKVQALEVVNDAQVKGNLYCNGTTVVNGAITSDTTIGAGSDLAALAGNGVFNWASATGFFNTSTGTNYINGNVSQAGAKTFTSGTGAFDVNGPMTTKGITQDSGSSLAQSGASGITVGTTGITATASPLKLLENVTVSANKSVVLSGTGTISGAATISGTALTASGTVQGEQLTSTDDALVTDDLTVDGAARIDETATINAGVINTTLDINGATTTAAITVDAGSIVTADQYKRRTNTTSSNTTITDGGADLYLVGNGTGVNSQTITLPTAADNKGRIITVILATDPLTNTVIIDGEGSEQVDGANTKTTTDAVGSMYHLICSGTAWIKLASAGTWS